MSDLCEEDYDLIITGGSLMKDTIQTVAPMYPDIPFICYDVNLDFDSVDMPNVYAMDFHQNEAAYMAGVIAASMTKSDYVGFVGATKIPVIYDFMVGFISGAQAVNPDIKVAVAFTNDFNDATLAKELALAQITDGADVLSRPAAMRRWAYMKLPGINPYQPSVMTRMWLPNTPTVTKAWRR